MAETIDAIDIEYTEDDKIVVKQLDKNVLTRGSWTTIMFLYQELDKNTQEYGAAKVSIRRYQKRNGVYRQQSKFNISSAKQANEMIVALQKWYPKDGEFVPEGAEKADEGED
ncbi:MAG: hypothetical protein V4655_04785 [Bdellovibrionota bacterium]|nr:MAG: hypothetical protein EOP10_18805 [Pseudomonadota bacterium]